MLLGGLGCSHSIMSCRMSNGEFLGSIQLAVAGTFGEGAADQRRF